MVNKQMLSDLLSLGVRRGVVLLVHSSYKSLGKVPGGMDSVIGTLLEAVGGEGSLLMPALSYESVTAENPHFCIKTTPSCVGAISEFFRNMEGVVRSMSPTHSVCAFGSRASEIVSGHHLDDTPVGGNSPFRKVYEMGGQILFIGCGMNPNTSMHGVEELICPDYLFLPEKQTYFCRDIDGTVSELSVMRHNFEHNGKEVLQRYDRIRDILCKDELNEGMVLSALCQLIEARPMWEKAAEIMRKDPHSFVSI